MTMPPATGVAEPHERDHLVLRLGHRDRQRPDAKGREPVALVGRERRRLDQHAPRRQQRAEAAQHVRSGGGFHRGRHEALAAEFQPRTQSALLFFARGVFVGRVIRALVFDFDGLILDTETPLIDAYGDVHAAHGKPFDREEFLHTIGHVDFTFDPWRAFGPNANEAALEAERHVHNQRRTLAQPLLPGVAALLDAARAAGLRLGVASNSSHRHVEGHLTRLGLHAYFEFFACRGDTPSPKPEPDLYRLVLNRFGLRGTEAIAFEDSQAGVTAAKRAGLWVVAVPGVCTAGHDFSAADLRLASLADCTLDGLRARFGA
jgi:HAD superfamily hydrolase (TIGR01509 family)